MAFVSQPPSPPLAPFVALIWDCELPQAAHRYERVLPQPGSALILNLHENETRIYEQRGDSLRCTRLPASTFDAPRTASQIIDTAEQVRVMGVVFRPGGALALVREPQERLQNLSLGLEDLFGAGARSLRERLLHTRQAPQRLALLDGWLRARIAADRLDPTVAYALDALQRSRGVQAIGRIVRDSGVSPRRFGSRFRDHVGMGPKHYARLLRFRRVVEDAHRRGRVDWADVAADCGFHDQPHLVREFRAFSGLTPTQYLARSGPHLNHVPLG